jgi:heme exporter protein B
MRELIRREILTEFRQKSTLGGVLIYVAGTIFISALCFRGKLDKASWNALFWIIILFTSVTVSGKSFLRETGGQALFSYLYYDPGKFILAKIFYHMGFMTLLNFITFLFYSFFVKDEADNAALFMVVLLLSSSGLAAVLSLMSAIASRAGGNFALMSILSFPVVAPLITVSIRLGKQAVDGIEWAGVSMQFIVILIALNAMIIALAYLLFPYIWKE